MKKIILLSGDHIRHRYIADKLVSNKYHLIWITIKREKQIPKIKKKMNNNLKKLYLLHMKKRFDKENFYFNNAGNIAIKKCKEIIAIPSNIKTEDMLSKIYSKVKPAIFLTYGCKKLDLNRIKRKNKFRCYFWNIHAGLSPWYRGSITHFWPTYLLEPEFTGMTLHEITNEIDQGHIIDQTKAVLKKGDGIHDSASRALKLFGKNLKKKIEYSISLKSRIVGIAHKTQGRIWTNDMWSPKHLIPIYKTFGDKIVDYCLKNKKQRKVILKTIFKKKFI